jgi:GNAT superfamily N-acetyltransferase
MTAADDVAALNAGNPLPWQAELWQKMASSPDVELHWFTGLLDGEPVGFGAACPRPLAIGGYGTGIVAVRPEARGRGVGTALHTAVADACRGKVPGVQYSYFEGYAETEAVVAAWDLEEVGRHRESVLDLTTIDREQFAARTLPAGLELDQITSLDDLDEDDWHALHTYFLERMADSPDAADGGGVMPYGVFRVAVTEPWMILTARKDGAYAALTIVIRRMGEPESANTFFTGVSPEHRGQGLAGALKAHQALALADRGIPRIYTQNMDGNLPILAANRSMGFVTTSGYVDVRLPLPVDGP